MPVPTSNSSVEKPNVAEFARKMLAITVELGKLPKNGRNKDQNYSFVSYVDLNAKLQQLLAEKGIMMLPSFDKVEEREIVNQKTGRVITRSVVQGSVTLIDCYTGYSTKAAIIGADNDSAGKATGKAITEAMKRWEMKTFHVVSEDADPDSHGEDLNSVWGNFGGQQQQPQGQYQQYPAQNGGWR